MSRFQNIAETDLYLTGPDQETVFLTPNETFNGSNYFKIFTTQEQGRLLLLLEDDGFPYPNNYNTTLTGADIGLKMEGYAVDDQQVPLTTAVTSGSNPMVFTTFRRGEATPVGQSVAFNGSAQYGQITDTGATLDFSTSWSLAFWVDLGTANLTPAPVAVKAGSFAIIIFPLGGGVLLDIPGIGNTPVVGSMQIGAKNHIGISASITGPGPYLGFYTLWVNGQVQASFAVPGITPTDNANPIYFGGSPDFGQYLSCKIDDIRFYNVAAVPLDFYNLYNEHQGTQAIVETGPTAAGLVLHHLLDTFNTSGDPITSASTPPVGGYEFKYAVGSGAIVPGLVATGDTRGVCLFYASPGITTELYFTLQMSHRYLPGTPLQPHLHYTPVFAGSGVTTFGLEYTISNANEVFGYTNTLEAAVDLTGVAPYTHQMVSLGVIPGTGLHTSFMMSGRVYRKGTGNTFPYSIGLLEFDIHYATNRIGDGFSATAPWNGDFS